MRNWNRKAQAIRDQRATGHVSQEDLNSLRPARLDPHPGNFGPLAAHRTGIAAPAMLSTGLRPALAGFKKNANVETAKTAQAISTGPSTATTQSSGEVGMGSAAVACGPFCTPKTTGPQNRKAANFYDG